MDLLLQTQCFFTPIAATVAANAPTAPTSSEFGELVETIANFGIMAVICAVVVIFMYRYMNNIMKRDNKLFENMNPKLDKLSADITALQSQLSTLITNHNAHASQSLRAIERDETEIRSMLLEINDSVNEISGQLTALQGNYESILRILTNIAYGNISLPYRAGTIHEGNFTDVSPDDITDVVGSGDDKK